MKSVLIAGAGTIGKCVAQWLASTKEYSVHLIDVNKPKDINNTSIQFHSLDVNDKAKLSAYIKEHHIIALISTLPYFCNIELAGAAGEHKIAYFDPTEDIATVAKVRQLAEQNNATFVPQCGLAPGYINIIANSYIQEFEQVSKVKLRCGALPTNTSNALHYAFTWSVEGLINEYINSCEILVDGHCRQVPALEEIEEIEIDGNNYEAFLTSGGVGTLAQTFEHKVPSLDYKTIRYPGHVEKMKFLINDMNLREDRETLKNLLLKAVPFTEQDTVLVYVSVTGERNGRLEKKTFAHKYYPTTVFNTACTALQLTTTAGITTVVDIVLNNPDKYKGFVTQEMITLKQFYANRFGKYLAPTKEGNDA